jgi:hypothetical protein
MVQAQLHAGLVQLRPLLEQSEVEAAVGEGDVARIGAADFLQAEAAPIKAGERDVSATFGSALLRHPGTNGMRLKAGRSAGSVLDQNPGEL